MNNDRTHASFWGWFGAITYLLGRGGDLDSGPSGLGLGSNGLRLHVSGPSNAV